MAFLYYIYVAVYIYIYINIYIYIYINPPAFGQVSRALLLFSFDNLSILPTLFQNPILRCCLGKSETPINVFLIYIYIYIYIYMVTPGEWATTLY